jgi:retinol dehydrogenase 12
MYIAARSQQKTEAAIADLKIQTGKTALYLNLDLADLKSVKASAKYFLSKEQQLHVLFNNA